MARHNRRHARNAPAKPAGVPRPAPGVAYIEDARAPGLKLFACAPHKATLSMRGCATRWLEAQGAPPSDKDSRAGFELCRSCPIGAAHAGSEHVRYSALYGAMICPACGNGTTRMIGNRTCVTCYNRRREMRAGKNARGNAPVELLQRPLHAVRYRLQVDGRARRTGAGEVLCLGEAMLQTLRTTKGDVAFGFRGPDHVLRQARLF